ncbi:DNA cytosine methyltransferase [Phaeobacter inhibens]|uniref:DNA cytosine methyltransferase n=1 Tax=Phaeobacter inhibens TaxID=221822 RepID=UPI0021A2BC54|nr:DNA cytosine methyltransferase [Phaeobacter inhibens]UWR40220.1 DNA cytosine methyltransferase [Phaeobacter inhibens]
MNALFQLDQPTATPINARPMIIDSFAGGGGASTGIEMALGRSPDVAINHDAAALAMHQANHPDTLHLNTNVWHVDPAEVCKGRRVGLAWFSPDCKHHSKAKGGKPVKKNIRDLAWVVVLWAKRARPDVIMLENVEEFRDWGPLTAENRPCPDRKGQTFKHWIKELKRLGYKVEWQELRACDYGAPTIRKRLFLIARCDGRPIVWPAPTHGAPSSAEVIDGQRKPWRTAAEIIDWSLPCPSIFDSSDEIKEKHGLRAIRPLADATLRRVARGVMRYVIDAKEPFLVTYAQQGGSVRSGFGPMHTITASPKDQNALIVPTLVQTGYGERAGQAPRVPGLHKPLGTAVAGGGKHALVAAFLAQHNAGERMKNNSGRPASAPLSTLTTRGTQQQIVAAHLMNMHGNTRSARDIRDPHPSICAGGRHGAIIGAFLQKYYGQGVGQRLDEPLHTLATRDTFGLVTVEIHGETYAVTDIGMRMLTPREQFRAQSFPDRYQIDRAGERIMTKTEQTRMCGNSVPPVMAEVLASANAAHLAVPAAA